MECLSLIAFVIRKKLKWMRLNFLSILGNHLVNSLFYYIVNFIAGIFNFTWSNFCCLVNCVSTSVSKIIAVQKASCLPFSFSINNPSFPFLFFFLWRYKLNFKFSGSTTRKPSGCPFFISIWPSKDLFTISTHKQCFP